MLNLLLSKYKLIAIVFLSVAIFGAGVGYGIKLSDGRIAKLKLEHAEKIHSHEQTLMEMERQAKAEIDRLNEQANQANSEYVESLKHAQTQINQLISDLDSSKRVLKPKVKSCVSTVKTDNTGATITETRAELNSETARGLVGITARCDEITLQLNALIDAVKPSPDSITAN
jgi:DNA repair exonuclease SbcCD ATPase subunit